LDRAARAEGEFTTSFSRADGGLGVLGASKDEAFRGRQNVFLQATPIDVGPILRECLWSKLECAVLTSATLAVGGGFEYIRSG
jgi:Rad3-related DNA helicase